MGFAIGVVAGAAGLAGFHFGRDVSPWLAPASVAAAFVLFYVRATRSGTQLFGGRGSAELMPYVFGFGITVALGLSFLAGGPTP